MDAVLDHGLKDQLIAFRHRLHQQPELSFQEVQTAKRFAEELSSVGATVTTGVGGHGVVAMLETCRLVGRRVGHLEKPDTQPPTPTGSQRRG